MDHAKSIALAKDLLADGRGDDVVRMIDPLLELVDAPAADTGQLLLRALRAQVAVVDREAPDEALSYLPPPAEISDLCTCVRADVTLWRGWVHALRNEDIGEATKALRLLSTAGDLHDSIHDPAGRCWSLLGAALAYLSLDEYALARNTLEDASSLVEALDNTLAQQWFHRLRIPALQTAGRYDDAWEPIDALRALASTADHSTLHAIASAHAASLHAAVGNAPSTILEAAEQAETVLSRSATHGAALLATHRAQIEAHLRRGDWTAARETGDRAARSLPDGPVDFRPVFRAQIALRRGAEGLPFDLTTLLQSPSSLPRGMSHAEVMHMHGRLLARQDQLEEARTWLRRAERAAQGTGDRELLFRTRVSRTKFEQTHGEPETARSLLPPSDALPSEALPLITDWYALRGDLTREPREAHRAHQLAAVGAALVENRPQGNRLRSELDASTATGQPDWDALLDASLPSIRLTADLSLRLIESRGAPGWIGIARIDEDKMASFLHERGTRPESLPLSGPIRVNTAPDDRLKWTSLPASDAHLVLEIPTDEASDTTNESSLRKISDCVPPIGKAIACAQHAAASPPFPSSSTHEVLSVVAESDVMRSLLGNLSRAATSRCPVLLSGERGTGKARLARRLHTESARASGPFERVRLADLQHTPTAERLFGTVDASGFTPGALHLADGGTLLLEDVEALPLPAQATVLEAIDAGTVVPEGGTEAQTIDVRIVATTTTSLNEQVRDGTFRPDLRDRFSALSLSVPPLRNRRADIPLLVREFLKTLRPDEAPMASITQPAMEALLRYDWPGNVRQLRNEIERVLVHVSSEPTPTVDADNLLDTIVEEARHGAPTTSANALDAVLHPNQTLSDVLSQTETAVIERVLEACDGQVTASAEVLGLTRQGLYKKMKRLGVDASEFQPTPEPASTP